VTRATDSGVASVCWARKPRIGCGGPFGQQLLESGPAPNAHVRDLSDGPLRHMNVEAKSDCRHYG